MIAEAFTLSNPFDYQEFMLTFPGLQVDKWHYAHVIGTTSTAMHVFPGHSPEQAYMLALWDMSVERAIAIGQDPPGRPVFEIEDAPPPDPSFSDMAKSVGIGVVSWIAAGSPVLSDEERQTRLETCKACEDMANSRCRRCGCFLAVKSWMRTEQCPRGKW